MKNSLNFVSTCLSVVDTRRNRRGGSGPLYFSKYIGIEAEFEGYGSYTHNFTVTNPTYCPTTYSVTAQRNLFTYNIGPIVKFCTEHIEPFLGAMFGGAHSNFYRNLYKDCTLVGCTVASKSPSNNAFDFIIGGGIDIPIGTHFALRKAQFFRYQAGVAFRF